MIIFYKTLALQICIQIAGILIMVKDKTHIFIDGLIVFSIVIKEDSNLRHIGFPHRSLSHLNSMGAKHLGSSFF